MEEETKDETVVDNLEDRLCEQIKEFAKLIFHEGKDPNHDEDEDGDGMDAGSLLSVLNS